MLISPANYYYGSGSGCSPCNPSRCLKQPPPCPKCDDSVFDLAAKAPWRKYFECLSKQELEDLLHWAERHRLYIRNNESSDLSVILAALHFLHLGQFQELAETSYLGIMGSGQVTRKRYYYGDGWNATAFGAQYLDLKKGSRRFAMGTSY